MWPKYTSVTFSFFVMPLFTLKSFAKNAVGNVDYKVFDETYKIQNTNENLCYMFCKRGCWQCRPWDAGWKRCAAAEIMCSQSNEPVKPLQNRVHWVANTLGGVSVQKYSVQSIAVLFDALEFCAVDKCSGGDIPMLLCFHCISVFCLPLHCGGRLWMLGW